MRTFILFGLCLLAGCTQKLEPTMPAEMVSKGHYQQSDNYADHRLQQSYFASEGGNIAYLDAGQGPVLLMIHGVPTSSWMYRKMIDNLQDDFRVIAVDLLGFGSSDKPKSNDGNYRPESQARYLEALLASLDVGHYNLVFHDMGGLVAWELVTRDMQKDSTIQSLTILNTIISKQGFDYPKMKKGAMARAMSEAFSSNLSSAAILRMTFNNMGLSSKTTLSEEECFGYVAPMREGADEALYEFYTGFDDELFDRLNNQISGLSSYRGKTQLIWGAQDTVLTTEQLPQLLASLSVDLTNQFVYPNNAHFLPEEIPDELSDRIRKFLIGPSP